jgi:hypothetical protein
MPTTPLVSNGQTPMNDANTLGRPECNVKCDPPGSVPDQNEVLSAQWKRKPYTRTSNHFALVRVKSGSAAESSRLIIEPVKALYLRYPKKA